MCLVICYHFSCGVVVFFLSLSLSLALVFSSLLRWSHLFFFVFVNVPYLCLYYLFSCIFLPRLFSKYCAVTIYTTFGDRLEFNLNFTNSNFQTVCVFFHDVCFFRYSIVIIAISAYSICFFFVSIIKISTLPQQLASTSSPPFSYNISRMCEDFFSLLFVVVGLSCVPCSCCAIVLLVLVVSCVHCVTLNHFRCSI